MKSFAASGSPDPCQGLPRSLSGSATVAFTLDTYAHVMPGCSPIASSPSVKVVADTL